MYFKLLVIIPIAFLSSLVRAADPSVALVSGSAIVPTFAVPAVKAAVAAGVDTLTKNQAFNLDLKWNESVRHFSIAVPNSGATELSVVGVQASAGLYVTSIPARIPASGTANINALLVASSGSADQMSVLRVLTNTGEIVIQVNHTRDQAAQFSATHLKWSVGGAATAQTVTLTMAPNTAVPTSVQALGGNTAKLTVLGGGKYTITVTPSSTAKETRFPVVLNFQPSLVGAITAISCEISP